MFAEPHDPDGAGGLPPGARLLSIDEAVDALVQGDHPDARLGSLGMDGELIKLLRAGLLKACRLSDGRLAFSRHHDGRTGR